jgi:ribosomal protein S18 acetylase RimI-like enzyme
MPDLAWQEQVARRASGRSEATFVAVDGGECVGLVDALGLEAGTVELAGLWVHPARRRSGIGEALTAAVVRWAVSARASKVALWVVEDNEPARRLYRRAGFSETGDRRPVSTDPTLTQIRMIREID